MRPVLDEFTVVLSVCSSFVLDEVERQSTCELEVDAVAVDILNRLEIESKSAQEKSMCVSTGKEGVR